MANTQTNTTTQTRTEIKYPSMYNVIAYNDEVTPMHFVIELLIEVFNQKIEQATTTTLYIHEKGQAVAGTYSLEIAESKVAEATALARSNGYPLALEAEKVE